MTREQITLIKKEGKRPICNCLLGTQENTGLIKHKTFWELRRWPNYCFCYHPTIYEVLILNITSGKASVILSFLDCVSPPAWADQALGWDQVPGPRLAMLLSGMEELCTSPGASFSFFPAGPTLFWFRFQTELCTETADLGFWLWPSTFFLTTMKKDRKNDRFRLSKAKSVISRLKLDDAVKFISFSIFPVEFIKLHLHFHFSGSDV